MKVEEKWLFQWSFAWLWCRNGASIRGAYCVRLEFPHSHHRNVGSGQSVGQCCVHLHHSVRHCECRRSLQLRVRPGMAVPGNSVP